MKKRYQRLCALLLSLCMALTLFPAPAYAAVGDLIGSTDQNQSTLAALQAFRGTSYQEAYDLLDRLGLLDENGNVITDEKITMDGAEYTLGEIEEMLATPDVDLSTPCEVDGTALTLRDLQTIIAIERELQRFQETYFSGASFGKEAAENANSLLSQLQTEGLTLSDGGSQGGIGFFIGIDGNYTMTNDSVTLKQGATLSVKIRPALNPANKVGNTYLHSQFKVSFFAGEYNAKQILESVTIDAAKLSQEYTLTYTNSGGDITSKLGLCVEVTETKNDGYFANTSYGNIASALTFYDAQGFYFDGIYPSSTWTYFKRSTRQYEENTTKLTTV